jgi:hypothetical protein
MKLSRRDLLAMAGTGAVLAEAAAQAQNTPPAPAPETPEARLATAREDNRQSAERLAKFEIPITSEPAFFFRA